MLPFCHSVWRPVNWFYDRSDGFCVCEFWSLIRLASIQLAIFVRLLFGLEMVIRAEAVKFSLAHMYVWGIVYVFLFAIADFKGIIVWLYGSFLSSSFTSVANFVGETM